MVGTKDRPRAGRLLLLVAVSLWSAGCLMGVRGAFAGDADGNVGGVWRTNWVDMLLRQGADGTVRGAFGAGGHGSFQGRLEGTRLNAIWSATPKDGKPCASSHEGKAYWGEVEIHFGAGELSGSWSACGDVPTAFTGRRLSVLPLDADLGAQQNQAEAAQAPKSVAATEPAGQAAAEPQPAAMPQASSDPAAGTGGAAAAPKKDAPAAAAPTSAPASASTSASASAPASAPMPGQRKTPPPPPFRGGDSAYLERFMPLRGEFPLPMFRGDNPRVWSVTDDERYPLFEARNPKTGLETLTWKYTALVEGTIDEEGKDLYETYISIARGDAAAIERDFAAHRAELEARFEAGDKTGELSGIRRIQDFDFGQGGYILVRGDRQDMHEIRYRDDGLLITVRCSPWFGGMDYCPYVGSEVDRKIKKVRKAEGE